MLNYVHALMENSMRTTLAPSVEPQPLSGGGSDLSSL
ncbi:MAG: hypothetical protein JWQ23_654, partial [Herminiimonas sp.]|nr:hypothetical protein [Herminiimonas sp.]